MAYLHNNLCFGEVTQLYQSMAASCPVVTSDGKSLTCTPTETGYTITKTDGVTSSTIEVNPPLIDCAPQYADAMELGWMCVGVIMVAWGMSVLKKVIK